MRISLRQVLRRRSYGVIFSIALGITAFITLSVLGREIRYNIGQDMVLLGGVNVLTVFLDDLKFPDSPRQDFLPETIDALRAAPGVLMASANLQVARLFTAREGERFIPFYVSGTDQYFWPLHEAVLQRGRFLTKDDVGERRRVCLLGKELAELLFGAADPVGRPIFLGNEAFEVAGVFSGIMMGEWNRWGFIPHTTLLDRYPTDRLDRLFVRAVAWEDVHRLREEIPKIVALHQKAEHLVIRTQEEQLARIRTTFMWVEALLWLGIAASLMLGGFGIWNGTFAAVRARTREVGMKKAMGGSDTDILAQFLTEALCKSVAGGISGIALGVLVVETGAYFLACSVSYPLLAASSLGSIFFSALIGVGGGIYPAVQAGRMDVVSALRFE
jgi:putative ABC transport system permease protein